MIGENLEEVGLNKWRLALERNIED